MVRWTRTYLAVATSSTALVTVAVITFVIVVATQGLHDWPVPGLSIGSGSDSGNPVPEASTRSNDPGLGLPRQANRRGSVGGTQVSKAPAARPRKPRLTRQQRPPVHQPPRTLQANPPPSATDIDRTVNETIGQVDQAVGGALSESGLTEITGEVVEKTLGPNAPLGKVVDSVGR